MLGQSEGVVEDLLAELADVVANLVLDLGSAAAGGRRGGGTSGQCGQG